ncbi:MAG: ATP-binding protein [Deltaproteobacteria bacterium]|nr:ATP-binding protein [Deltaproteobacteria bacterium]
MNSSPYKGLRYQFLIIASLIFVLPVLILFYIFYQADIAFDFYHLLVFTFILLLVLAGMMALRFIFDRIFNVADSLKKASESGKAISTNLKKDVTELDDILCSFNHILQKFEQATEQAAQRTIELNAVKDIGEIVVRGQDIEEMLMTFLDKALDMTKAQKGSLFIVEPDNKRLRLIGSRGTAHLEKGTFIKIDDSLIKLVFSEKRPLLVQNIEDDPRIQKKNDPKYGAPSFLSMPISVGRGDVTAVINLSNKKTGELFDANDENALSIMEAEISFTLENVLLHSKLDQYIRDIEERNIQLENEINSRKQTEAFLRKSEARFRELADLLPQTVFEVDLQGNLLFANGTAFEAFGYTQEDLDQGLNIFNLFIHENRERISRNTRKILSGENLNGVEYAALKKDGSTFPIAVYACPIVQDNHPAGLRGIAIDITDRKQAEETQQKLHEELVEAEKRAAVGTCAAGIAHEVKNPLAIIIQGVEYLKSSLASDAVLLDVAERIKNSALRADTIVKGLLSFTRQMPIQAEDVEITPIIEETLSFVEYQINARHIRIVRQYAPDLPAVKVDVNQIKQVFVNILLNAVEAMQDGGTITISLKEAGDDKDQRYLQIVMADTGCGIPEGKIGKVFDPFYTTKDTPGNAGLGLSVTKGIIDKHHGKIRIESEADRGTRVIIGLPAGNAH